MALQDAFVSADEARRIDTWMDERRWDALFEAYDKTPDGPLRTYMTMRIAERALERYRIARGGPAADRPDEVARLCFLTEAGFDASHRWANRLADEGRLDEAADVLERVMRYHPDADALTAARLLQLRKDPDGFAVAKALAARHSGNVVVGGEEMELARFVESLPAPAPAKPAPVGSILDGDIEGHLKIDNRLWKHEFRPPLGAYRDLPGRFIDGAPTIIDVDGTTLVIAGDGADIVAIEAATGKVWWKIEDDSGGEPSGHFVGYGDALSTPTAGATAGGDQLYALMGRDIRTRGVVPVWCLREIVSLEARSGVGVWKAEPPYEGADWTYAAPPIVRDGRLYSGVTAFTDRRRETAVICHDRETGKLLWKRRLCRHRHSDHGHAPFPLVSLAIHDDRLIAADNDGEILALRAATGEVDWAAGYERKVDFVRDPSPPIVHEGNVYVLPQDRPALQVFALADGRQGRTPTISNSSNLLGGRKRAQNWEPYESLIGFCDGHLVVQGRGQCLIMNLKRDRTYDMYNTSTTRTGRGAIVNPYIYLPNEDESGRKMAVFEGGSWKYRYSERWKDPDEGGTLAVRGPLLVAQGTVVSAYADFETLKVFIKEKPFDLDVVWSALRINPDPALEAWFRHLAEHRPSQATRVEWLNDRAEHK